MQQFRDKIILEIQDMSFEQLKEYFDKQKTLHPTAWKKSTDSIK